MRKQGIRKSLGVFLAMCFLSVIYVVFHSDKDVLDDVIKRQSGGSKDYVVTWQDETFDMTITYKKQGQAANAGQFLSKEKTKKELLKEYIATIEKESRDEDSLVLPKSYMGAEIIWEKKIDYVPYFMIILGAGMAIAVYLDQGRQQERLEEDRKRRLLGQYPQFVGVLTTLLDSGMSLRYAVGKITVEHLGGGGVLQEELEVLLRKLQSGMGMNQALLEFADSCNVKQYRKLAGLLVQNQEKGTSGIKQMLNLEVQEAENLRLYHAKQAGEKIQTKLLLPMSLLLALVIVILIVPAWMQIRG